MTTNPTALALDANMNFKRFTNIFCEVILQTEFNLLNYKPSYVIDLLCDGYLYAKAHINNAKPCLFGQIPIAIIEVATGYSYHYARLELAKQFKCTNDELDKLPVILLVLRKFL